MTTNQEHVALVTGGSAGLGLATVRLLADQGWRIVTDARHADALEVATADLSGVVAVPGDIGDPLHREELSTAVHRLGRLDLLVHNASALGPMLPLADVTPELWGAVLETNLAAPLALTRLLLPHLRTSRGALVTISSDAAVEHYPTWGAYGASKAALDHAVLTLGAENDLRAYAVDPGDMRTAMHQQAFPGEDISDRPLPETVVERLLAIVLDSRAPGRYRVVDEPAPRLAEAAR